MKPRLTARIVRGLESVYTLAEVNKFEDSDLYAGSYKGETCREGYDSKKIKEVNDAIEWLGQLIEWHKNRK